VSAVDTNVVVRLIVKDDSEQRAAARALLPDGIFVSRAVLMEVEWVLRSAYALDRQTIGEALSDLLALAGVDTADTELLRWALDRYRAGADWADMLHLIDARGHGALVTFDRHLAKSAGPDAPIAVRLLK
jgi:predicted nucleic-acid-binding protein